MRSKQYKAYKEAEKFKGLWEWKGSDHNPKILKWFADVGHSWVVDDETAWCAAFVGAMLEKVNLKSTRALNARSYLKWGEEIAPEDVREGDIVVFKRGNSSWQGHVAFYVDETDTHIFCLGGNQSNQVNISKYPKSKFLGFRRGS